MKSKKIKILFLALLMLIVGGVTTAFAGCLYYSAIANPWHCYNFQCASVFMIGEACYTTAVIN
jgi:hypothetical protein